MKPNIQPDIEPNIEPNIELDIDPNIQPNIDCPGPNKFFSLHPKKLRPLPPKSILSGHMSCSAPFLEVHASQGLVLSVTEPECLRVRGSEGLSHFC